MGVRVQRQQGRMELGIIRGWDGRRYG